mmetsp:Transcript_34848/g.57148  ORF Transcript_34848/g.57148 Transcript_34848/m.57148 type:complete len:412 (+) Transcript_34848:49-1284(+)
MLCQHSQCFLFQALSLFVVVQISDANCALGTTSVDLIKERGYDLTGQTHVITGGDSGIGFNIALALAQANARIIFLGHNMAKTAAVMRNITGRTSNNKLSSIPIDLMSFASVREAADKLLSERRIDAVICDAGLVVPLTVVPVTADGFESSIQIQYLSHFYLVELLLPQLRKTRGRVVHTSTNGIDSYSVCKASGLPKNCLNTNTLMKVVHEPNQIGIGNIYLGLWMKSMHARLLAHKEASSGVSAYSFHPGLVATGDMQHWYDLWGGKDAVLQLCFGSTSPEQAEHCENNPAYQSHANQCPFTPWFYCMCPSMDSCPITSEQGAVTGTYLASAPKAELASVNGAWTVACDYVPLVYGDPFVEMVAQIGPDATLEFVESFYRLSLSWVPSVINSSSIGMGLNNWGLGILLA